MLAQLANKHRRAASVVKTALISKGISNRSICVTANSWDRNHEHSRDYAVFISSPIGSNIEPYFETGETLLEAVKKIVDSIRGKNSAKSDRSLEVAPF